MELHLIVSAEQSELLHRLLSSKYAVMNQNKIKIVAQEQSNETMMLNCLSMEKDTVFVKVSQRFVRLTAEAVSVFTIKYSEPYLIKKYLSTYGVDLSEEVKSQLTRQCRILLHSMDLDSGLGTGETITKRVELALHQGNCLDVRGFLDFRLQDYRWEIEKAASRVLEDYYLEQDQNVLKDELRHFLGFQVPFSKNLDIRCLPEGLLQLSDGISRTLELEQTGEYDDSSQIYQWDDAVLLQVINAIEPKNIMVHTASHRIGQGVADSLRRLFGDAVNICSDCAWCNNVSTQPAPHS